MILAALMGHSEVVSLLLDAGADVRPQDNHGLTASDWAQRRGFPEIAELITNAQPLEQRAGHTKPTTPQTLVESQPAPPKPDAELETESDPVAEESSAEMDRRRSVGFGPAAKAILKATAKPAQVDSEAERPSLEDEEAHIATPASRTRPEEVMKGQAHRLPSAEIRNEVEPKEQRPEDRRVADPAQADRKEQPATPTTIRSEPTPRPQAGRQDPASQKSRGEGAARRIRPNEPRRETDHTTPTAIRSERLPVGKPVGDPKSVSAEPHDAESALRIWANEPERLTVGEAEPAETLQSRMETERIFEEARKRVESEVRRKAQYETRGIGQKEPLRELGVTHEGQNIKRCPTCNTVYEDDTRTFCVYDSAPLISLEGPLSNAPTQTFGRGTLWALVAITLLGSVGVTYLVSSYLAKENSAASTPAALSEAPAKAEDNLPIVGGALVGKVVNLPNADYPVEAKSEGISGAVVVVVRVNKKGRVISARALNGNPLLRAAAERAARKAIFSPEKLTREEGIAAGTITYIFKP